jgi:hypothetical protein
MNRAVLLSCLCAFSTVAVAQSSCPVVIEQVNPKTTQSWSRVGRSLTAKNEYERQKLNDTPDFVVKAKNMSGKQVRGLKMQAAFFDATEDLHMIPISWNAPEVIKDGESKNINWENALYNKDETMVGWVVVVQKILFEDGTKWDYTSAAPSCYGEWWKDKRHPRLTKLPMEEQFQMKQGGGSATGGSN